MWMITKDYIADPARKAPSNSNARGMQSSDWDETKKDTAIKRFRMKDDDGYVYYAGIATPGSDFRPLDEFGAPNAGCTSIEYLTKGAKWEVL